MGRRKKRVTKKAKNGYGKDVISLSLLVLTVLLFILIYGESGSLGKILSPTLGGIIGFIKYIIPFGTLVVAIGVRRDEDDYVLSRLFQCMIFLACVATILSIYTLSKSSTYKDGTLSFTTALESAYELGTQNHGGGTVGTVIAYPLMKLIGPFASSVVTCGVAVIIFVFNTGGGKINKLLIEMEDKREIAKEQREEELNARRERRMAGRTTARSSQARNDKIIDITRHQIDPVDENQITINLNGREEPPTNVAAKQSKFGLFQKAKKEENPEQVDAGIYKNTVKQAELNAEKAAKTGEQDDLFKTVEEEKEDKTKSVLTITHTQSVIDEDENYEAPPISLLQESKVKAIKGGAKALTEKATKLQKTLYSFGVSAKVENITVGPAITRYELKPAEGVRVSKIANLADDIALNLAAETIRIEAPIPGKQAVGIEIPNKEKQMVPLRDVLESDEFKAASSKKLSVALGKDVAGTSVVADISKMPHVLIAGSTGSGKSVCINTIISSFIYNAKPSEVKLVMVDPKVVELSVYNGIPHLLIPVVTDPKKAAGALAWAVTEMDNRYGLFAKKGVRDLKGYNHAVEDHPEEGEGKLPQIVIIIDELADLMMVASKEVEEAICRLAQKARAAGMHLVIATQRPSVDVITGLIKANIPSRIAFAVSSQVDSRTILDQVGAEKLLGKGDMLYYPAGSAKPTRVQGAFISDEEVEKIVGFVKSNGVAVYNEDIIEKIENANKTDEEKDVEQDDEDDTDPFLNEAIETVISLGTASTSLIQRKFKVGYARAGRIIDQMEARGIISGYEGSKPRQVLMSKERWAELNMSQEPVGGGDTSSEE